MPIALTRPQAKVIFEAVTTSIRTGKICGVPDYPLSATDRGLCTAIRACLSSGQAGNLNREDLQLVDRMMSILVSHSPDLDTVEIAVEVEDAIKRNADT